MAGEPTRPRFTVVSAVHDVAVYLPEFIASIEGQDFDLGRVEVVVVDDGSTDDSRDVLEAWAARRPDLVHVISQANAGQGAARNAGMDAARGEWVTFPDPDDVLDPSYLRTVDAFLETHPDAVMVAVNRLMWDEATGARTNTHPLRRMFGHDRLVDLDRAESSFHGSAPAAFFDLDRVRAHDVRFDVRIRPNFEDGHFCSSYLLRCERPLVGFLASTRYHYRKRADRSSSLQGSMRDPRRYTDVFEFGYLALLDEAQRRLGGLPLWLQHFLCYELLGYLVAYDTGRVPVLTSDRELESFHAGVRRILERCDLDRVLPRLEFGSLPQHRAALAHGYAEPGWRDDELFVDTFDGPQQLARVRYWFTGDEPEEQVCNGEVPAGARDAKTCDYAWFGRVLVRERILWVPFVPDLSVAIDGRRADLSFQRRPVRSTRATARDVRRLTGSPSRRDRRMAAAAEPTPSSRLGRRARKRAATRSTRERYQDAWVLIDQVHRAGDNAEALFRRLRTHHRDVNAWFVVAKGSPDWGRLHGEFGDRMVAHGSLRWRLLMAHCAHLLSSHVDPVILQPPEISEFTEPAWRFTFLQHGVITEDLSRWLATLPIDVFVTSTPAEHDAVADGGSRYPFTTKEVQLTGLPRFDRLLELGERSAHTDLVLLAPTWRRWLVDERTVGEPQPRVHDDVLDSDFVRRWVELASSPALAEECRRRGMVLGLLLHPLMSALGDRLDLPDHVQVLDRERDIQELIARAGVLVTDYSSIAFDAAYLDRPVVYFQFDADLVLTGGHLGRQAGFRHDRDGFGPVVGTADEAARAVTEALSLGPAPASPYAERIAAAFPQRDGRCSERVIAAVQASTRPRG